MHNLDSRRVTRRFHSFIPAIHRVVAVHYENSLLILSAVLCACSAGSRVTRGLGQGDLA